MATTMSINAKVKQLHRAAGLPDLSSPRQKMLKRGYRTDTHQCEPVLNVSAENGGKAKPKFEV